MRQITQPPFPIHRPLLPNSSHSPSSSSAAATTHRPPPPPLPPPPAPPPAPCPTACNPPPSLAYLIPTTGKLLPFTSPQIERHGQGALSISFVSIWSWFSIREAPSLLCYRRASLSDHEAAPTLALLWPWRLSRQEVQTPPKTSSWVCSSSPYVMCASACRAMVNFLCVLDIEPWHFLGFYLLSCYICLCLESCKVLSTVRILVLFI